MRWLVILLALVACERGERESAKPVELSAVAPRIPAPVANVDAQVACKVDSDCEIHVSCCAHCGPTGTVLSLNKAYAPAGSLVTLSFYCPMCAEGGCTKRAPKRDPICKQGTCARRDTEFDDTGTTGTATVVDNKPSDVERARDVEVTAAVLHRACMRYATCGRIEAAECDRMKIPFDASSTKKCFDEIDHLKCEGPTFSLATLDAISKLPACAAAFEVAFPKRG